jgi:hypothetical protein
MPKDQAVRNAIDVLRDKDDPTALEEAQTEWTIHKQDEELTPVDLVEV